MNELESLRSEMAQAGIPFTGQFIGDDKIHRYKTAGDREENCWYSIHQFPTLMVAVFGCWKRNLQVKWTSKSRKDLSREDWNAAGQAWRDMEAKRAEEERKAQEKARGRCAQWLRVFPRPDGHLYLAAKGVEAHGPLYQSDEELTRDWLALPLQDIDGTVHSMQFIAEDGTKRFVSGGRVAGCYYPLAEVPGGPLLVCEGYATGASLFEATGWSVVCAMNCGNLLAVVQSLRKKYPARTIVLCADNDQFTDGNPGLTKAQAAAKAVNGLVACPDFSDNTLGGKPTDFNDLHTAAGLREVARQVYDAFPVVARSIGIFARPPDNDPTELLKYRYLCQGGGLLFNGPTGVGKCLRRGTRILMFDGTVKAVEDVRIGDALMGPDSLPRIVQSTCSGTDELYEVSQKRRGSYVCNSAHVLSLTMTNGMNGAVSGYSDSEVFDIPLSEYLGKNKTFKHCAKGFAVPIDWPEREVPLPPYFLGLWLGDGTRGHTGITNPEPEVIRYIHGFGASRRMFRTTQMKNGCSTVTVTKGKGQRNPVLNTLRELGVANNKHIPLLYRANSESVRMALLAGLIDSDGHVSNKCAEITSKYQALANDIAFLARSLGFRASISREFKRCQTGAGNFYWRVLISGDLSRVPSKAARKKASDRRQKKRVLLSGLSIKPIGRGEYAGFELDGDGRFLLEDFTVTHNSSLSVQSAACWCNVKPFFGIRPSRSLSTVIIQAENDDGDVAEMRDGVCKGLNLTEEERYNFFSNVFIYSATKGVVGDRFCQELVRPLLDLHDPDLLMIDPMLSFVGGNVKEQEVVGNFLRASLNPVIFEHECGMVGYHHTNKPPSGKEKQAWTNGELAYLGSGSAEWANWARAVLSLQSMGKAGYYKLHAAKRGARIGWTDDDGQLLYERYLAWSRDGSIYWREPTMEEVAMLDGSGQEEDKLQKKADKIPARFLNLLQERALTKAEWAKRAKSELGYSNGNAYRYIQDLERAGRVFLSVATARYSIVIERTEPNDAAPAPQQPDQPETPAATPDLI